jgi:hypothetical protein
LRKTWWTISGLAVVVKLNVADGDDAVRPFFATTFQ